MRKILLSLVMSLSLVSLTFAQGITITGIVTSSEDGLGVPGASIVVKGTTVGTVTDFNGAYSIQVPGPSSTLVFSFIGFRTQEIVVGNQTTINLVLEAETIGLDELVVIGYGTARSVGTVVGSITTVSSEKIEFKPVANVWDAIQGRVAGMQVYTSSGEPSQLSSVRLHGVGSLGASSTPLYVLDGIPISPGNMLSINPNDIESLTVLKDASATSIYGSRAANGVIYVTTKRGIRDTKAKITVNTLYGSSSLANEDFFNRFMNTKQLTDFWLDVGYRTQAQIDALLEDFPNDTKWHKYYYKETAPTYQADIAIQGGSERTTYYVSGGFFSQDGLAARSLYERYSFRANINSNANDWLSFGSNIGLSTDERQTNPYGTNNTNRGLAMLAQPFYTPFDEDGKPYRGVIPGWNRYDPYYLEEMFPSAGDNTQLNVMGFIQINPIEGLTIRTQGGIDAYDYRATSYRLPSYLGSLNNGYAEEYFSRRNTLTLTNTAEYKRNFGFRHDVTLLVGQEFVGSDYGFFSSYSSGHTDDRLLLLGSGPDNRNVSQGKSEYAFLSYFGRIDYAFDKKYYADFSIRQDASSRFGRDNRTAMFYSAGLMWDVKKETFMENLGFVSAANFKASIGTSGNSEIADYAHYATVGTSQYDAATAWLISSPGNPLLSWEKQMKATIGLKFALFDKFRFNVEYYNRQTESMLISVPQPYTSGFNTILENVGTLTNTGIDFEFDFDVLRGRDYHLTPYVNFNYNKNEVTELFQDLPFWIIPNTGVAWVVGQPVAFYRPLFAGIDPADGAPMWYVPGDDRTVTRKEETTKVFNNAALEQNVGVPRYAPWSGGFGLTAQYKGFGLAVDFAFVKDKYLFNNDRYFFENPNVFGGFNQSTFVLDYWKEVGDESRFPSWSYQFTQFDSRLIEDASFLRMKNLTLSYIIPSSILQKTNFLTGTRIFVTGRNLLTFTKYEGPDPEVDSNITLGANPNTKQVSVGLTLNF
jgi:TonB-linked SusC/RagA family outer membrane protein